MFLAYLLFKTRLSRSLFHKVYDTIKRIIDFLEYLKLTIKLDTKMTSCLLIRTFNYLNSSFDFTINLFFTTTVKYVSEGEQ